MLLPDPMLNPENENALKSHVAIIIKENKGQIKSRTVFWFLQVL